MNAPKPHPPKKSAPVADEKTKEKRVFSPKPHLTTRPFQDSEDLRALQSKLNREAKKQR